MIFVLVLLKKIYSTCKNFTHSYSDTDLLQKYFEDALKTKLLMKTTMSLKQQLYLHNEVLYLNPRYFQ
jgi:hypothetical protein